MNSFINATSEMFSTTGPVTFIHNTPHGGVVQNCEVLVFIVSAASIIGWDSPAIVTGGFPMGNIHCIPVLFSFLLNRDAHYGFHCFVFIERSLMGYNKNKSKLKQKIPFKSSLMGYDKNSWFSLLHVLACCFSILYTPI